jgi:hypothetical protein
MRKRSLRDLRQSFWKNLSAKSRRSSVRFGNRVPLVEPLEKRNLLATVPLPGILPGVTSNPATGLSGLVEHYNVSIQPNIVTGNYTNAGVLADDAALAAHTSAPPIRTLALLTVRPSLVSRIRQASTTLLSTCTATSTFP